MLLKEWNKFPELRGHVAHGVRVVVIGHIDYKKRRTRKFGHDLRARHLGVARSVDAHAARGLGVQTLVHGADGDLVRGTAVRRHARGLGAVDEIQGHVDVTQQVVQHPEHFNGERARVAQGVDQLGIESQIEPHEWIASVQMVKQFFHVNGQVVEQAVDAVGVGIARKEPLDHGHGFQDRAPLGDGDNLLPVHKDDPFLFNERTYGCLIRHSAHQPAVIREKATHFAENRREND